VNAHSALQLGQIRVGRHIAGRSRLRFLHSTEQQQQGVLRIFYADSPRISVVLAMLRAARAARRRGIDIVIGALPLPFGPQRQISRALNLKSEFECLPMLASDDLQVGAEFDLAAALRRSPSIIATGRLLAATNDGTADAAIDRWYQGIEGLLAAGIEIWAALHYSAAGSLQRRQTTG
jgi:two-component system sensor histidine kinase KdpD